MRIKQQAAIEIQSKMFSLVSNFAVIVNAIPRKSIEIKNAKAPDSTPKKFRRTNKIRTFKIADKTDIFATEKVFLAATNE